MATLSDFMPREIEILYLILTGRINKAYAAKISISEKTVGIHHNHICTKIAVCTCCFAR